MTQAGQSLKENPNISGQGTGSVEQLREMLEEKIEHGQSVEVSPAYIMPRAHTGALFEGTTRQRKQRLRRP